MALNLKEAYLKLKKTGEKRSLDLFEKEVDKFISSQVKEKEQEISNLKENLKEYKEETIEEDTLSYNEDILTQIDNFNISSREGRKGAAIEYVLNNIRKRKNTDDAHFEIIETIESDIEELREEIEELGALRNVLENIDPEVEEDNSDES